MGVTDRLVEQFQASIVGESAKVQFAATGFGRHPILLGGGLLGALIGKPRNLVVTDQAVVLVKAKRASNLTPDDIIGTYPRALSYTSSFLTFLKVTVGDETIYISKIFAKGLRELFPQG